MVASELSTVRRVRRWRSVAEKRQIVQLTLEPGASISGARLRCERQSPGSSTSTFSGERLAIFRIPQGAGLQIAPHLYSQVQAQITDDIPFALTFFENADWSIRSNISVPGGK